MAEYKNKEQEVKEGFNPSPKEVEVVEHVYQRYLDMKQERDKPRREFDNRTLTEYVNDSMDAYNGIVSDEIKASKENWQSLIWDHKTRSKVKTLVAMIVNARPFIFILGKNRKSDKYAKQMLDIYEDTWKQEKGSYKLYLQVLSTLNKGTIIVEECYTEEKIKRKTINKVNQETGEIDITEEEVIKGGVGKVEAKIIPLLDFFPNENSAEIEHDCCVLKQFNRKEFENKFGKYPNAKFAKAGNIYFDLKSKSYKEQTITPNDLMNVLFYYNEDWDEYIILADNIWLNKQTGDKISPIPFDHKRLPFAKTVFELADENYFYGKSLPDLMRGEQDPTNALERLMVDREILSLNRGFFLGAGVEIESYALSPGSITKLTGPSGIPIQQMIMEQDMNGANQSGFQMLQLLKNNADLNTSVDSTAQGVHSGRKTARESVILDENSKRNVSPFSLHIYKLLTDRAELRISNIQQFYTSPLQMSVLEDNGEPVVDSQGNQMKTGEKYREITVAKPGKKTKWFNINPEIKGCEFHLRFVDDYEMPQSQSTRIEMAKALLDESKVNSLISGDEATIDYLESIRKNPDRFYLKPTKEAIDFQNNSGVPPMNKMI